MAYRILADALLLLHLGFVLFALFGGLWVLRRRGLIWLHLPALAWGIAVETFGWICPLTSWEKALRESAGDSGYPGGFIEHYVLALLYPEGLTRTDQALLAAVLVVFNLCVYGYLLVDKAYRGHGRE